MGRKPAIARPASEPKRQLIWFLCCRILVISLFLGGTIVYQLRVLKEAPHPALQYLYLLVGLSYIETLLSAFFLPKVARTKFFAQIQIVWDLLFAAGLIYLTGGIESLFSFLFLLIIFSASVFLSRKELLFVASAAAILYGSLIDLQFYGLLPVLGQSPFTEEVAVHDVFFTVFVNVVAFFLTALLSGLLAERLRRSELAFAKKAIDYEEVERLNRTILANISSGLMIVNTEGRIRLFNESASRITGLSLEEVYDREVDTVFPDFHLFDEGGLREISRGEAVFEGHGGRKRILGFASSRMFDPCERKVRLLVTFQDLTRLKELEEDLKRADRLAAVGQLASGMAHEIRNPLASISGSVQLLMEGEGMSQEDCRLMGIVVREAERLSALLTDFLAYARPAPPQFEESNVSQLLDELCDLACSDSRFQRLDIRRNYPTNAMMTLDRQQIHQALWNLIINAAEAMDGTGTLRLCIDAAGGAITVEDSGPGIPLDLQQKVFDPFFTTKAHGTGLGLASVFAVVEAHDGRIEVCEGAGGGARFTIVLSPGPAGGAKAGSRQAEKSSLQS